MSRRRFPAAAVVLCTFVLSTMALAGCGSASPRFVAGTGSPSASAGTHGSSGAPRSGSPAPHTSGPAGGGPSGTPPTSPTHTPESTAPVPGISAHPHAVKLPPWPHTKGTLSWRGPVDSMGSTGTSSVALTFDDGPGPYTSSVLDLLDQYHVKATFCLIGRQIHNYRQVIKRMIDDGMTICNHSWDHDEQLGKKSVATIAANLRRMVRAVHKIVPSAQVAYFRQPAGNFTKVDVSVCEQLGMRPLYWSVDTSDWTRPGTDAIVKSLTDKVHPGSIVLMHDAGGDRSETIAALKVMLPKLQQTFHLIPLSVARTATVTPPPLPKPKPHPAPSPSPDPSPSPPATTEP